MDAFWGVVWAVAPTILLGLLFWYVMRQIVRSDRNERRAYAKLEAKERARRGLPPEEASTGREARPSRATEARNFAVNEEPVDRSF